MLYIQQGSYLNLNLFKLNAILWTFTLSHWGGGISLCYYCPHLKDEKVMFSLCSYVHTLWLFQVLFQFSTSRSSLWCTQWCTQLGYPPPIQSRGTPCLEWGIPHLDLGWGVPPAGKDGVTPQSARWGTPPRSVDRHLS